jgi:basic amino acid/polyamine antiporter, APA family
MAEPNADADGQFRREIGLFDATMLVMGAMIGSGIFIVSKDIAADVLGAGWLLAAWVLTGVLTVMGALCYAELAGMMPDAGGQYVYLKRAYSPFWGFLYGWALFAIIQTGSIAAVAVAFTKFLGVFVPALGTDVARDVESNRSPAAVVYRSPDDLDYKIQMKLPWAQQPLIVFQRNKEKPFTVSMGQFLAAAIIAGLTLWNCRGVKEGKIVQNVFTVAKIGGLIMVIAVGFAAINPDVVKYNLEHAWDDYDQTARFGGAKASFPAFPSAILFAMVLGGALVGSLFSADAWNNVTFTGGEVKNPRRTLPLALALGATAVILLYVVVNVAYLCVLPVRPPAGAAFADSPMLQQGVANAKDDRVATAMMEEAGRRWQWPEGIGAKMMAVLVMVSTFGCLNGMILMGARLYYAMARDGLFFHSTGRLNSNGVPAVALILQGIWSIALIFSGTYSELLDYVIFAALLFYVLTVIGLFRLRRKEPDTPRPYRVWFYPLLPAMYVVLAGLVMVDLLFVRPDYTWPGLVLVLTGVPVYLLWRLFGRKMTSS